jgi:hypothetical protein
VSQVVTELVIDSDTSGADRFSDAMGRAGDAAQSSGNSVVGMTLAIAGVSVAAVAAVAGLRSFVDYVGQQTQQLVDLSDHAQLAGMSLREFNSEWKQAVAAWDLQFKATMASVLPLLAQAADLARTILDGIGSVSGSFGRWLTPTDQQSSSQLNDTINDVYRLRENGQAVRCPHAGSYGRARSPEVPPRNPELVHQG